MKRLLDAMAKRYPLLSAEEQARNELGKDLLVISDRHPLYDEIATNFYSKRQGSPKYKLKPSTSEGLAGKIEKNEDYLPGSALSFPLGEGVMPDLEEDHSIRYGWCNLWNFCADNALAFIMRCLVLCIYTSQCYFAVSSLDHRLLTLRILQLPKDAPTTPAALLVAHL